MAPSKIIKLPAADATTVGKIYKMIPLTPANASGAYRVVVTGDQGIRVLNAGRTEIIIQTTEVGEGPGSYWLEFDAVASLYMFMVIYNEIDEYYWYVIGFGGGVIQGHEEEH